MSRDEDEVPEFMDFESAIEPFLGELDDDAIEAAEPREREESRDPASTLRQEVQTLSNDVDKLEHGVMRLRDMFKAKTGHDPCEGGRRGACEQASGSHKSERQRGSNKFKMMSRCRRRCGCSRRRTERNETTGTSPSTIEGIRRALSEMYDDKTGDDTDDETSDDTDDETGDEENDDTDAEDAGRSTDDEEDSFYQDKEAIEEDDDDEFIRAELEKKTKDEILDLCEQLEVDHSTDISKADLIELVMGEMLAEDDYASFRRLRRDHGWDVGTSGRPVPHEELVVDLDDLTNLPAIFGDTDRCRRTASGVSLTDIGRELNRLQRKRGFLMRSR